MLLLSTQEAVARCTWKDGECNHLHAKSLAHERAFHLLPLNAQRRKGSVLPIALVVIDEVLHDRRGDDIADVLSIFMLHSTQL